MNATWIDRPAVLPAMAFHIAARTLAAPRVGGGGVHPLPLALLGAEALTVRNTPNIRSSAAPISPTDSCACREDR